MNDELFDEKNIQVFIKRDDLIHSIITGNKWRKLKDYLLIAQKEKKKRIITFGGAYSNHVYALAYACKELNLVLDVIIRGDELSIYSNEYLTKVSQWGANLHFISRTAYKDKIIPFEYSTKEVFIIPEGGFSSIGVNSLIELSTELEKTYSHIFVAVGTGTTLIGLAQHLPNCIIHGVLCLSNLEEIENNIQLINSEIQNIVLHDGFISKRYGKKNTELEQFCIQFYSKHRILIEPIYTGLLFKSFYELVNQNYFKSGENIVLIHSGGIK